MSDERMSIQESIHRLFWAIDERDWAEAARGVGKRVQVGDRELTREEIVQEWIHRYSDFDTTQHLLSAIRVQIDRLTALAFLNFQAHHLLDGEHWTVGGRHELTVDYEEGSWRVTEMKTQELWEQGNPNLLKDTASG